MMTTPPQSQNSGSQTLPSQQQQQQQAQSSSSSTGATPFSIPQLVVIKDQVHNTYKHPIIHYVFEEEPFPDIAKDKLIVVDYDSEAVTASGNQDPKVESYSPHFQVSHCRLEQSTVNDQFDASTTGLLNLILEGVSAPQTNEAIESLQPVQSADGLMEMIFNFKNRFSRHNMAKGIRSHVKKRANVIKRATVFKPVEDSRLARLAALQAEAAKKPSVGDHMEEVSDVNQQDNAMATDEPAKISTSGPRKNSKYLRDAKLKSKKQNKKNKKKSTNVF